MRILPDQRVDAASRAPARRYRALEADHGRRVVCLTYAASMRGGKVSQSRLLSQPDGQMWNFDVQVAAKGKLREQHGQVIAVHHLRLQTGRRE